MSRRNCDQATGNWHRTRACAVSYLAAVPLEKQPAASEASDGYEAHFELSVCDAVENETSYCERTEKGDERPCISTFLRAPERGRNSVDYEISTGNHEIREIVV